MKSKNEKSIVAPFSGDTMKKFLVADSAYNRKFGSLLGELVTEEEKEELEALRLEREKLSYLLAEECF